jgi:acyl-coenzyme A thioesterase PaaI-like protein
VSRFVIHEHGDDRPQLMTSPWADHDTRDSEGNPILRGGPEFAELNRAQRVLQDRLAGAALPADVSREVTTRLDELNELLAQHQVNEHGRRDGMRIDLPGRAHPLLPPYLVDEEEPGRLRGRVTFTRFYLGGNHTAHGGAHSLLFDDVLGRVVNTGLPSVGRTAFLKVDYRRVVPLGVELHFEATRDSVDGRKRWGSGRILDADGTVLSEAHGLFVELLPGQA